MMNTMRYSKFMVMVMIVALVKGPILCRCQYAELGNIYDITHKLQLTMPVWNSTKGPKSIVNETWQASGTYYGTIKLGTHLGTHVDSPGHVYQELLENGGDITSIDLHVLNGPALVVETPKDVKLITADVLKALNIPPTAKRVLLKTANTFSGYMKIQNFTLDYAGLTTNGAEWIASTGIELIGIDYLSVALPDLIGPVHRALLAKDASTKKRVTPVECLNLDEVNPGTYTLHCLPLRVPGADGSPARCILVE